MLKQNEWKTLVPTTFGTSITVKETLDLISEYYNLDKNVVDNVCITFHSHSSTGKANISRMTDRVYYIVDIE